MTGDDSTSPARRRRIALLGDIPDDMLQALAPHFDLLDDAAPGCELSYTGRSAKQVPWRFVPDIADLAGAVDVLVLSCAGPGRGAGEPVARVGGGPRGADPRAGPWRYRGRGCCAANVPT